MKIQQEIATTAPLKLKCTYQASEDFLAKEINKVSKSQPKPLFQSKKVVEHTKVLDLRLIKGDRSSAWPTKRHR